MLFVKDPNLRRLYIALIQIYKILEKTKLHKSKNISGHQGLGGEKDYYAVHGDILVQGRYYEWLLDNGYPSYTSDT